MQSCIHGKYLAVGRLRLQGRMKHGETIIASILHYIFENIVYSNRLR